jgi:hypothetical protein
MKVWADVIYAAQSRRQAASAVHFAFGEVAATSILALAINSWR